MKKKDLTTNRNCGSENIYFGSGFSLPGHYESGSSTCQVITNPDQTFQVVSNPDPIHILVRILFGSSEMFEILRYIVERFSF
jgi:hypothetical protein